MQPSQQRLRRGETIGQRLEFDDRQIHEPVALKELTTTGQKNGVEERRRLSQAVSNGGSDLVRVLGNVRVDDDQNISIPGFESLPVGDEILPPGQIGRDHVGRVCINPEILSGEDQATNARRQADHDSEFSKLQDQTNPERSVHDRSSPSRNREPLRPHAWTEGD